MAILQRELLPALRGELLERAGVPLPAIAVRAARLPAAGWRLLIDEVPAAAGRCPADEAVALVAPAELDAVGIPAEPDRDPATGVALARIAAAHAARAAALAPVRGPVECLGAALAATLRRDAHLLVGVQEVQALLDDLESTHPALVREAVRQVPTPVLADVVRQLLEEGVSIRPFRRIVEALLTPGGAAAGPAVLVQSCRRALRRQIAHQHAAGGTLQALLLDPAAEARVREALDGEVAALEPLAARALLAGIERLVPAREEEARVVVLSSADVRRALRQLVAQRFPRIAVLSYDELPPALPVRALGKIELGGDGVGG
jgi:type III secretion protein V